VARPEGPARLDRLRPSTGYALAARNSTIQSRSASTPATGMAL
jgi:hypothetical protein